MADNTSFELEAREEAEELEDSLKGKYLTFSVGEEDYGIEITYVTEIIGIQAITQVPEQTDYVKGFINLRGKIIPVIDLRLRFRKPPADYNDRTCIVVIDITETAVGLIVDTVADVITIPESEIVPSPDKKTGFNNKYIKGVGKVQEAVKLLIDCERLFSPEEVESFSDIS